jgi:nicotinate-nucleotide adenylyltransferase
MSQPPGHVCRIGFFGGSFDPPHRGHLAVAQAARVALGLDKVLFAPVGAQPLKPDGSTAGFDDRVAMTRLAIAGERRFEISLADAPKPSGAPNYTVDTLNDLKTELPPGCALFCLMGADSLAGLQRWYRAAEIPFVAPLIVASRPGEPLDDLRALLPQGLTMESAAASDLPDSHVPNSEVEVRCYSLISQIGERAGQRTPLYLLPGLDVEISASQIRELARAQFRSAEAGQAAGYELLPDAVSNYIRLHGLYR